MLLICHTGEDIVEDSIKVRMAFWGEQKKCRKKIQDESLDYAAQRTQGRVFRHLKDASVSDVDQLF